MEPDDNIVILSLLVGTTIKSVGVGPHTISIRVDTEEVITIKTSGEVEIEIS